jgi:hypothetical protein
VAKLADATFKGKSGKEYAFEVFSINHNFPNIGAVYIFLRRTIRNGNGSDKLIYVGQTGELADRISDHEKWPCAKSHDATCICVHKDSNETSRRSIEKDLVDSENPPCNKD